MTGAGDAATLLRRGRAPEVATLAWNVVGIVVLATYLLGQSLVAVIAGHRATSSPLGIVWTAATAGASNSATRSWSRRRG